MPPLLDDSSSDGFCDHADGVGVIGSNKGDFMVYGDSSTSTFGMATDTIRSESNVSLSPPFIGSEVDRNVFLFLAPQDFKVEKKEKFLDEAAKKVGADLAKSKKDIKSDAVNDRIKSDME